MRGGEGGREKKEKEREGEMRGAEMSNQWGKRKTRAAGGMR